MEAITTTNLEESIDGERDGEDGPGEKADEERERIEEDGTVVILHRGSRAGEIVFEEEASEEFAIGGEANRPVPGERDGGSGENGGGGPHRPAGFEEVERIERGKC